VLKIFKRREGSKEAFLDRRPTAQRRKKRASIHRGHSLLMANPSKI